MKKKLMCALAALALTVLTAVSPLTARAAGGLELYTDYPGISVKAGDSESIAMHVSNESGSAVEASLNVLSLPEGWTGYFSGNGSQVSRVHVQNGAEADLTFQLQIPEEAAEGSYTVQLQTVSDTGLTDTVDLTFDIQEVQYSQGTLETEYAQQEGASGTSFTFNTTLINNSAADQSYSLSAEAPQGWQVSFQPSGESTNVASVDVTSAGSQGLTVSVTPPENVEAGEYTIPVSAVSANDSLSTDLKITITGTYSLALSTPNELLSFDAHANQNSDLTLNITNTGNVDLQNVSLNSSLPSGWTVTYNDLEENVIESIPAGSTVQVIAHVKPGSDAITGDYVATFTAQTEETSAAAEFRVSVKTGTLWGAVAILIILAVAAGLGYVFHKYGRR